MNRLAFVCLAIAFAANDSSLQAGMLTYTFRSEISSKTDPYHLIDNINLGDDVTYVVNVDTEAENLSYVSHVGIYASLSTILTIGGRVIASDPGQVEVWSNAATGPSSSFRASVSGSSGLLQASGDVRLVDYQKTAIPSAVLPVSPYSLPLFEMRDFQMTIWDPSRYEVEASMYGPLYSFTITPEPSSLGLVGLLLVLLSRRTTRLQ